MPKKINLNGNVYPNYEVIKYANYKNSAGSYMWECLCNCGKTFFVAAHEIKTQYVKSCGCKHERKKDHIGEVFGKLTIISKASAGGRKAPTTWNVKCECGTEKIVSYSALNAGVKSCGCWKKTYEWINTTNRKPLGVASRNRLLGGYKYSAKVRNMTWNLSDDLFNTITKQDCYYCGIAPYIEYKSKKMNGYYKYNGIDRVVNEIGYEPDNVVPCCKVCNIAKANMPKSVFLEWIHKVAIMHPDQDHLSNAPINELK